MGERKRIRTVLGVHAPTPRATPWSALLLASLLSVVLLLFWGLALLARALLG